MFRTTNDGQGLVALLWGNSVCNDATVLRHLLRGGVAFDMRSQDMIAAPTLNDLPPGYYRLVDHEFRWPPPETDWGTG